MIEFGDLVRAVVVAAAIQLLVATVAFIVFKAQATEWHKSNQARFGNIEKALGIKDPDDTAFIRRSEAIRENDRVWKMFDDHDERISSLEINGRK